jgi:C_GCAxxG_C_C family probable redox protein
MNYTDNAVKYFSEGASCAQAILMAYGPVVGLSIEQSMLIGSGLGGGLGRRQHICGAINAGAIILGLKYGNSVHTDLERKEKASVIVGEFVQKCEKELGGTQCFALLKIDLNNAEEKAEAKASGLFDRVCNNAVMKSAEILENYLKG